MTTKQKVLAAVLIVGISVAIFVNRPRLKASKPQPVSLPPGMESMQQWEAKVEKDNTLPIDEFNRLQIARRKAAQKKLKGKKMALLTPTIVNATATNAPNAFDGNDSSYAALPNNGDSILINLGAAALLDHIVVRYAGYIGASGKIYASDASGTTGELLLTFYDNATSNISYNFPASKTYQYVKFVENHSPGDPQGGLYTLEIYGTAARTGHVSIGLATGAVHEAVFMDDATVTSGDNYSADTKTYGWFRDVQITILNPPATGFVTSVAGSYWEKGGETIGHAVQQNQVLGLNTGLHIVDDDTGELYRLKVVGGTLSVEAV